MHVTIARPLGESGKLTLTNDMTELEFALDAFMREPTPASASKRVSVRQPQTGGLKQSSEVAAEYKMLRSLRQLLFLDTPELGHIERAGVQGLPPLIVLHHIVVRSPMPLPHTLHGWHESEYVKWLEEHVPQEAWTLVEGTLAHWEKLHSSADRDGALTYIELAREVLAQARAQKA